MNQAHSKWVPMGYIKGAVGVKGWVKIGTGTEYTDSLLDYNEWRLVKEHDCKTVAIAASKIVQNDLQVQFTGITNREEAALLRGYTIEINREEFAETEENEYYWVDLIGLNVVNQEAIFLGTVTNLMETGAHDILVIDGDYGQKLIPFVDQYIKTVTLDKQEISVDWGTDY